MEGILSKHWSILHEDLFLKDVITPKPKVSYQKAKNIKSKIVKL